MSSLDDKRPTDRSKLVLGVCGYIFKIGF